MLILTSIYPTEAEPWCGCFVRDQLEDLRGLGIDVEVLRFDGRADSRSYLTVAPRLRSRVARNAVDLVHAHYGLAGATAILQRSRPVVTTFHGSDTVIPWQRAVSWFVARATSPIFVSTAGARRLGRPDAPVIAAAVDTDRFAPIARADARRALGWADDSRYVLLPGARANPVKDAALFDAVVELARRKLGDITPVSLEGYSRAETALVLNAVDVTLMTSRSEGAPVTIKESLACATPVVSVPVGDVPGLIVGLPGCAVVARDPVALAEALGRAVEAPRDLSLRERVQPFSRARVAARVADLYEDVLRRRQG